MPDERLESSKQGIAPPPESQVGRAAEQAGRTELINTPPAAQPDSAMGGTSDADSPGDEAYTNAMHNTDESADRRALEPIETDRR
jgi:hypothetical protein